MVTIVQTRRWDHTAAVMAQLANAHRDPEKRSSPYQMDDFHPYLLAEKKRQQAREAVSSLRAYVSRNMKQQHSRCV